MRFICLLFACCITMSVFAQQDTTNMLPATEEHSRPPEKQPAYVFNGQRAINATTVAMVKKGILEFKVAHKFDDFAGRFGGLKNFFGLDNALDLGISFQYGISDRFNVSFGRFKGDGRVQRQYELGLKWLPIQQIDNDPSHPISLALYGNVVAATMKAGTNPELENFVDGLKERLSYSSQLIIGRKFGKLSLQLNSVIVHRNNVIRRFPPPGVPITPANEDNIAHDQKTTFALGGAARFHLGGRYSLLFDYFHTFRGQASVDSFRARNIKLYNAIGVGFEITTWGHIFTIFFSNATDILENKFIPYTTDTWDKGQFHMGFSITRNFDLLYKKKNKKKN